MLPISVSIQWMTSYKIQITWPVAYQNTRGKQAEQKEAEGDSAALHS
jgi:hypothetical protein